MSSQDEEQEVFFEEEEVLWAKIRGYPWWPAFVDKLHPNNRGGETEYTVFFFGDNTHSKLGSSKLRKFYDNYPEFYQKAKSHKKLMISIQMAEEKLKQNDQNVQIFEQLRVVMKGRKKSNLFEVEKKESKISQPQLQISPSKMSVEIPFQLNKSKTFTHRNKKGNFFEKQQPQDDHLDQKEEKDDQIIQQKQSNKKNNKNLGLKQEKINLVHEKMPKTKPLHAKKGRKPKIQEQEIFQQQPEEKQVSLVKNSKAEKKLIAEKRQKVQVQSYKMDQEPRNQEQIEQSIEDDGSQLNQDEDDIQKSSPEQRLPFKKYASHGHKRQIHQRQLNGPRKRGRPKKRILRNHSSQQKYKNNDKIQRNNRVILFKKKLITKIKHSPKKRQQVSRQINPTDNKVIQEIRNLLGKRLQLIDYLKNTPITTENVKQILDLDVSNILQEGQLTSEINEILQVLKNTLLFKYFPDDIKHKKRYEKIIKKRNIIKKEEAKDETNEKEVQGLEEENEIRKKTIVKLEKFLKYVPQNEPHAKQMALKLESLLQNKDKTIGDKYKVIAFQVLSNLKERKETFDQIITKLDQNAYD